VHGYRTITQLADWLNLTESRIQIQTEADERHTVDGVTYILPRAVARLIACSPWREEIQEKVFAAIDGEQDVPPVDVLSSWDIDRAVRRV
jgi:hypothetical protein